MIPSISEPNKSPAFINKSSKFLLTSKNSALDSSVTTPLFKTSSFFWRIFISPTLGFVLDSPHSLKFSPQTQILSLMPSNPWPPFTAPSKEFLTTYSHSSHKSQASSNLNPILLCMLFFLNWSVCRIKGK